MGTEEFVSFMACHRQHKNTLVSAAIKKKQRTMDPGTGQLDSSTAGEKMNTIKNSL